MNPMLVLYIYIACLGDRTSGYTTFPSTLSSHVPSSLKTPFHQRSSLFQVAKSPFLQSLDTSTDEDVDLMVKVMRGQGINDDNTAAAGTTLQLVGEEEGREKSNLPYDYNPQVLQSYFSARPMLVLKRVVQVVTTLGGYTLNVGMDKFLRRSLYDTNLEVQRASELRNVITSLGPFYIKLGQALSIRPDILSPRTMYELQKLCDKVPSYDSKIAFATMERELGKPVSEVFSEITPEPVAAASLGQVYKATLRSNGKTVAVKVQRPGVLETVSLDLYLARELGSFARIFPGLVNRIDPIALLDEFAYRFFNELDYNKECDNGIKIKEHMKVLPMVVIPDNFPELTSRRVHVAEWIEGEKLSQSTADDVGALVNLGVITYLSQLLDSGFFHADPHPGNMMRTTDGRLAILDFGLMTEVTDDQKYGMIEAIAHLLNRDYTEIGNDFINLDFIPVGTDTKPIVPALTKVFDAALAGGGAKSINFQDLASDLAQITFDYPFRIPPYFALVIRAISVLEGIALVGNPNFAIIDEAFPYIARRLMTDKSPRLKAALRYMVYGRNGNFDASKLIDLLQALEKFSAVRNNGDGSAFKVNGVRGSKVVGTAGDFAGSRIVDRQDRDPVNNMKTQQSVKNSPPQTSFTQSRQDENTTREALRFFFSPEGEVFREFMLEEIAAAVDALSREATRELAVRIGLRNFPVPSLFRYLSPELTLQEERIIGQLRILVDFFFGNFDGAMGNNGAKDNSQRLRQLIPVVREYTPQLQQFGTLLLARLSEKAISRGLNWASAQLAV